MATQISFDSNGSKDRFIIYDDNNFAGEIILKDVLLQKIIIEHTGVEPQYEGKGYGSQLVLAAIKYAQDNQVKIIPHCPFAKTFFDKNPEYSSVLANS